MKQQILIIDDSKPISYLLQTILAKKFQVITAPDGYAAMRWLSRKNFPDMIIVSPRLPEMKNWELVEYLTSSGLYGEIPLVVLSGLDKAETAEKCEELGVASFFQKPFNPLDLEKHISGLLNYQVKDIRMAADGLQLKVG